MELLNSLNAIRCSHKQSVNLLRGYRGHIDGSIKELQKKHENIIASLEAARLGKPDPGLFTSGEQVTLSRELADKLEVAMKFIHGHTVEYPNLTYRMLFVYLVALFDAFLADIFSEIVRARPHILRTSKKQITYDKLLEFNSFDALVNFIVSREMNELSYKPILDQVKYYRERFGVGIEESGIEVSELIELKATRNLLMHNNGVVNHIYMELVPDGAYKLGEEVKVDVSYFDKALKSLETVADFITEKLIEKHGGKPKTDGKVNLPVR
jgi:hypothetical protein